MITCFDIHVLINILVSQPYQRHRKWWKNAGFIKGTFKNYILFALQRVSGPTRIKTYIALMRKRTVPIKLNFTYRRVPLLPLYQWRRPELLYVMFHFLGQLCSPFMKNPVQFFERIIVFDITQLTSKYRYAY